MLQLNIETCVAPQLHTHRYYTLRKVHVYYLCTTTPAVAGFTTDSSTQFHNMAYAIDLDIRQLLVRQSAQAGTSSTYQYSFKYGYIYFRHEKHVPVL